MVTRIIKQGVDKSTCSRHSSRFMYWDTFGVIMIHCFFLEFSSLVITKEGTWWNLIGLATLGIILTPVSHQSLSTMINLHTEHTRTPNRCQHNSQSSKSNEIPTGSFLCDDQRWKFKKKQWIMITPKVSHYIVDLSAPCLIILVNGYCMILWCWGYPNGRTDPECPVHVDSPTPCLIILVTINPMNIMVPKVSWWMNVQYVWTHPPLD